MDFRSPSFRISKEFSDAFNRSRNREPPEMFRTGAVCGRRVAVTGPGRRRARRAWAGSVAGRAGRRARAAATPPAPRPARWRAPTLRTHRVSAGTPRQPRLPRRARAPLASTARDMPRDLRMTFKLSKIQ